jgi:hypothetical protein
MKRFSLFILFTSLSFLSISQVNEIKTSEKPREQLTNSAANPTYQSGSKQSPKINVKRKLKQLPRKDNHELSPQKD